MAAPQLATWVILALLLCAAAGTAFGKMSDVNIDDAYADRSEHPEGRKLLVAASHPHRYPVVFNNGGVNALNPTDQRATFKNEGDANNLPNTQNMATGGVITGSTKKSIVNTGGAQVNNAYAKQGRKLLVASHPRRYPFLFNNGGVNALNPTDQRATFKNEGDANNLPNTQNMATGGVITGSIDKSLVNTGGAQVNNAYAKQGGRKLLVASRPRRYPVVFNNGGVNALNPTDQRATFKNKGDANNLPNTQNMATGGVLSGSTKKSIVNTGGAQFNNAYAEQGRKLLVAYPRSYPVLFNNGGVNALNPTNQRATFKNEGDANNLPNTQNMATGGVLSGSTKKSIVNTGGAQFNNAYAEQGRKLLTSDNAKVADNLVQFG